MYVESKTVELIETESRKMVVKGWRGGRNGGMLIKGYKLSVISDKFWKPNVQYGSMKVAKRVDLKCSHHTHNQNKYVR